MFFTDAHLMLSLVRATGAVKLLDFHCGRCNVTFISSSVFKDCFRIKRNSHRYCQEIHTGIAKKLHLILNKFLLQFIAKFYCPIGVCLSQCQMSKALKL